MATTIMDLMKPGFTTGDPFEVKRKEREESWKKKTAEPSKPTITMDDFAKMVMEKEYRASKFEKASEEEAEAIKVMKLMAEKMHREDEERILNKRRRQEGIDRLNEFINRTAPLVANPHGYLRENEAIPESCVTPEAVWRAAVNTEKLNTMLKEFAEPMKPENMKTGDREKDLHLEALQALADELADICTTRKVVAALSGPCRLSVVHRDKGRTVKDMIGGEEFQLIGAHIANKTGALWLHVRPVSPETFAYAEVSLEFAKEGHFGNLFDQLERAVDGGIVKRCKELALIKMREREAREMEEKQSQYADFGSW